MLGLLRLVARTKPHLEPHEGVEEECNQPLDPNRRRSVDVSIVARGDGREYAESVQVNAFWNKNRDQKEQGRNPADGLHPKLSRHSTVPLLKQGPESKRRS